MNIFVYGTLLDDTVRGRVLGKDPTIIHCFREFVNGKYFDVDEEDIKKLDRYESEYYKKIEVKLKSGTKSLVYTEQIYM